MSAPLARRLPIRLDPLPGEAIDSFLEALAARLDTPLGVVLAGLGLPQQAPGGGRVIPSAGSWICVLDAGERAALAAATGLPAARWAAMTLAAASHAVIGDRRPGGGIPRYPARPETGPTAAEIFTQRWMRRALWRLAGSRYCPDCLAETGGRWPLRWRIGLLGVCPRHRRLLADLCPACRRIPRAHPHSMRLVPTLGSCATLTRPSSRSHPVACGADLTRVVTETLPAAEPALHAAALVCDALTGTVPAHYADAGLGGSDVLIDLRLLAQAIMDGPGDQWLRCNAASPELGMAIEEARSRWPERPHHSGLGPRNAAVAAAAVTAAAAVVACPDPGESRSALRWIPTPEWPIATVASPVLADMFERTRRPATLVEALRYPSFAMFAPGRRAHDPGRARLARIPALLPREQIPTLVFDHPGMSTHTLRWALAAAICLSGSRIPISTLAAELGSRLGRTSLSSALKRLALGEIAGSAVRELAHALDTPPTPVIDYARRRRLDYSHLLPQAEAARHGWPASLRSEPGGEHARRLAYELLSGNDPDQGPESCRLAGPEQRRGYNDFVATLPETEKTLILEVGQRFLTRHGIHEPVTAALPAPDRPRWGGTAVAEPGAGTTCGQSSHWVGLVSSNRVASAM